MRRARPGRGFRSEALAALRALPGVGAAGFTSVLPFGGDNDFGSTVIDGYVMPEGGAPPHAQHRSIDEGYFAVLGVPSSRAATSPRTSPSAS